jgi:hypothetical protein
MTNLRHGARQSQIWRTLINCANLRHGARHAIAGESPESAPCATPLIGVARGAVRGQRVISPSVGGGLSLWPTSSQKRALS